MNCQNCGYENSPSRKTCKRCRVALAGDPDNTALLQALPTYGAPAALAPPLAQPPIYIVSAEHALQLLKTGTPADKRDARTYLADTFEERSMTSEAIELLEANARDGDVDPQTFLRLAGLYRQGGRHADAQAATSHATLLLSRQMPQPPQQQAVMPYQQQYGGQGQPLNITVSPQMTSHTVIHLGNQSPPLVVRLLYFLFIGFWFGPLWLLCALALFVPIITAPLAIFMLVKSPKAFFL